jgi:hypothetical protein
MKNMETLLKEFEKEFPDLCQLPINGQSVWLEKSYSDQVKSFLLRTYHQAIKDAIKVVEREDPQSGKEVNDKYWGKILKVSLQALIKE